MANRFWLRCLRHFHRLAGFGNQAQSLKSGLLIGLAVLLLSTSPASLCRVLDNQQICILSIERSAKNYWEYRAAVSIEGVKRPIERYNCRDRLRTQTDGKVVPFQPNGAGELICRSLRQ